MKNIIKKLVKDLDENEGIILGDDILTYVDRAIHQAISAEREKVKGVIGEDEMAILQSSMNSGRMSKQEAFIVEIRNKFRTELKAKIKDLEEKTNL